MIKQISILSGVIGLVGATSFSALTPVSAALPAPSEWTYAYRYNASFSTFIVQSLSNYSTPTYTRTTDGSYSNYTTTINFSTFGELYPGLEITQTFNRSNTSWTGSTTYVPVSTTIGSNSSVGSISNKIYLQFNNTTNKDYLLYFDYSSNFGNSFFNITYNSLKQITYGSDNLFASNNTLKQFIIPSNYIISISSNLTSEARYFDAWYLLDLGTSAAYQEGYDTGNEDGYYEGQEDGFDLGYGEGYEEGNADGYNEGYDTGYDEGYSDGSDFGYTEAILNNGIVDIISNVFDGMAGIFGISILGGITLGTLTLLPLLGMVLFFFKKFIQ
jgi:hypothetical protein